MTKKDIAALDAVWRAHPDVKALGKAIKDHATKAGLVFTPDGMTKALQFAAAWIDDHGGLPDSGIKAG